jgi:SOS-response transcriptional repressor LexA
MKGTGPHPRGGGLQRRRITGFVQEFTRCEGYSPSYRDIAEALGLAVPTVHYHVSILKQEGTLRRASRQPRTITGPAGVTCPESGGAVDVPLIGQVPAGVPVDAMQHAEDTFRLPRRLVGGGTLFMLRVRGDSMTGGRGPSGDPAAADGREQRDRCCPVLPGWDRRGHGEDPADGRRARLADAQQPGLSANRGRRCHHPR